MTKDSVVTAEVTKFKTPTEPATVAEAKKYAAKLDESVNAYKLSKLSLYRASATFYHKQAYKALGYASLEAYLSEKYGGQQHTQRQIQDARKVWSQMMLQLGGKYESEDEAADFIEKELASFLTLAGGNTKYVEEIASRQIAGRETEVKAILENAKSYQDLNVLLDKKKFDHLNAGRSEGQRARFSKEEENLITFTFAVPSDEVDFVKEAFEDLAKSAGTPRPFDESNVKERGKGLLNMIRDWRAGFHDLDEKDANAFEKRKNNSKRLLRGAIEGIVQQEIDSPTFSKIANEFAPIIERAMTGAVAKEN